MAVAGLAARRRAQLAERSAAAQSAPCHDFDVERSPATKVTVVIPTRNRLGFLTDAIDSIRAQTLTNWQVVVVDDASDDGSTEKLEELLGHDARLHLVALSERSERSTARNAGLAKAKGQYVLFLDDDDRLLPTALERLAGALDAEPAASVAIGARRAFDPRGHVRRAPHPRFRVRRKLTRELLLGWVTEWVAVPGQCLIRTELLREAGGWNISLVGPEDQELLLRLTSLHPAILVPPVVLEYRLHDNQWRPPDVREQEDAFRVDVASGLTHEGDADALDLLEAGSLLRRADACYDRWEYADALRLLVSAARTAPVILKSPIVAPAYLHLCAKTSAGVLVGSRGSRMIRGVRQRTRQRLRRSPAASVTILSDAPTLPGRSGGYRASANTARSSPGSQTD